MLPIVIRFVKQFRFFINKVEDKGMNIAKLALLVAILFCLSTAQAEELVTLEPITVTANKIEENVQEVPSSITVFSGDAVDELMMEGIYDVSSFTPNFTIIESGGPGTNTPSIRGMSADLHTYSTTVGLYVDGVPVLGGIGYEQALIDVERIEVLKGPQGTLYGKGAEAGIVNIITRAPDNEFRLPLSVELGTDGKIRATGTISGPIVRDRVYGSLSLLHDQRDGWVEDTSGNTVDDLEQNYVAAKLRFTPTDDLDLTLSGTYLKYDNGQPHMNLSELGAMMYGLPAPQDRVTSPSFDGYDKTDMAALSLKADYLLSESVKLSSVSSYRQISFDTYLDYDFAEPEYLHYFTTSEHTRLSEELRVSSVDSPIKWVAGIYADTDKIAENYIMSSVIPGMSSAVDDSELKGNSWSAFAHANVPFGDFSVLGGIRYDYQEQKFGQPSFGISHEEEWSEFSPKIGIEYRISEETMTYATVSKGYLSGGFNAYAADPQYVSFDEEKLWSYEIGIKNTFLDNRLILNAAAFYMDITDAQVYEQVNPVTPYTTNAAEVTSKGFEVEAMYMPVQGLTLETGFGYVDATFEQFSDIFGDYKGNKKPFAPEYTFNLGATYRSSSGLYCSANIVGTGKMYIDKANELEQDAFELVNAKIGYETDNYDVYLYGKNIFDKEYDRPYTGDIWVVYSQPAEYGATLTYRF